MLKTRYTETDFFGIVCYIGGTAQERLERLYAYESTGLSPEEVMDMKEKLDRLTATVRGDEH